MQWNIVWYDGKTGNSADLGMWKNCPAGLGWTREQLAGDLEHWLLITDAFLWLAARGKAGQR